MPVAIGQGVSVLMLAGKFLMLMLLLILGLINGHKEYINENPRKFLWDAIILGLFAGAPIGLIGYFSRNLLGSESISLFLLAFVVFFVYSILRELSGMNAASGSDASKVTQGEAKQVKVLERPFMYTMIAGIGLITLLALINLSLIHI